jgi:long-chain acyl-CoA synthetase
MFQEKPWLQFYEPHVPPNIDYPHQTLPEALESTTSDHPTHTAMIFKDKVISFQEFNDLVNRFAAALQALGVKKGDRVAIHTPNCPQFPISYYAVLRTGAIVVPCNPIYTAREIKHQLNDSGAKIIITLSSTYPIIQSIRDETELQHVIVARIKSYFPTFLKILFTVAMERKTGHRVDISGDEGTYWFTDLIAEAHGKPEPVDISWDDSAVLMYTGGTTGVSKGAQLTHKNIFVNAYQFNVWAKANETQEITLTTIPLFHSYGMTLCMNSCVLAGGTMILVPDPRDTTDILKTIDRHQPTFYPGVPAMYIAINNHPDVEKYNVKSLKNCSSGAAPLPVEVHQRFMALTGTQLREGYGLSEASPATHSNPAYGENRIGTIGIPWPDTESRIVDVDTGETLLDVGDVGELCIRGPQVMKGYWNLPTETANTLREDPQGGGPWLHTGDIAVMDKDGFFQIVDRKKDMILGAGGYNIYPREIEDVLFEHPKVLEAGVAGVPVPGKGERVKAFIVLKPGETSSEEEIMNFLRERLAPYKVPKYYEFRNELPKTLTGKVLRRALVAEATKQSES